MIPKRKAARINKTNINNTPEAVVQCSPVISKKNGNITKENSQARDINNNERRVAKNSPYTSQNKRALDKRYNNMDVNLKDKSGNSAKKELEHISRINSETYTVLGENGLPRALASPELSAMLKRQVTHYDHVESSFIFKLFLRD